LGKEGKRKLPHRGGRRGRGCAKLGDPPEGPGEGKEDKGGGDRALALAEGKMGVEGREGTDEGRGVFQKKHQCD